MRKKYEVFALVYRIAADVLAVSVGLFVFVFCSPFSLDHIPAFCMCTRLYCQFFSATVSSCVLVFSFVLSDVQ